MKKLIAFLVIGGLTLAGLGAAAIQPSIQPSTVTREVSFGQASLQRQGDAFVVTMTETNSWLRTTGAPVLPAQTTTLTFPFGTTINAVDVTFIQGTTVALQAPLLVAPSPVAAVGDRDLTLEPSALPATYPEQVWSYHLGAGVANGEHTLFLSVRCVPVQYHSQSNSLTVYDAASITVDYTLPSAPQEAMTEDFDLVIIAPEDFADALAPLVTHKIASGVTTKLVLRPEICDSVYFPAEGRDCAEEMKYFIKNAYDQWGTSAVMLVGGRHGGILNEKWWVPVRYSHLDDDSQWEGSYLSDLYFADLYDALGNFSDWDSNGNGIFAEWNADGKDIIDMYPELSVGRLACANTREVEVLVDKIVTYETTASGADWFTRMITVGGDSAPGYTFYEGEEENKKALEYMDGFTPVTLWTSDGSFTGPDDVTAAINAGSGFLFFDGHGNPMSWSTHPPDDEDTWINGLQVKDMPKLTNGEQLPVCVVGGCHNAQFNTSLCEILKGLIQEGPKYFSYTFYLGEWIPECWAWKLVSVSKGGSIATMGYAGLDWFAEGDYNNDSIPDCTQFFSGFANTHFFLNYGVNNMTVLGQAHTQTLIDYLNVYPPMAEKLDCKTVQEFVLLGDPSLQIGGYATP